MATASDITGSFTGIVRGLGSAVRNMGMMITAASAGATAAMVSLGHRAMRVSEAYREVNTIASNTADSQEKFSGFLRELNTEMGVNATRLETIDALYQAVSAGIEYSTEAMEPFLETASKLSVVGRVELATSVDVLTTAINAYGEDVMTAERASNALFGTVQFGKTTMDELAPVMGRLSALGSEMGASIEEIGASMAVLTASMGETRVSATGLRAVMRGFIRPSEQMQEVLTDIAMRQDGVVATLTRSADGVDNLAKEYRELTGSIEEYETAQQSARDTQEETNLAIQRHRLAITAIQEDRVDLLEDEKTAELARRNSVESLKEEINDYQVELRDARVREEEARQSKEELESKVSDLKQTFKEEIDTAGNLEQGIGTLLTENQGFVQSMIDVREEANQQDIQMNELFTRTRALQAALSLVGDDGQRLADIYSAMNEEGELTDEQVQRLSENFDELSKEDIRNASDKMSQLEENFQQTRGPLQTFRNAINTLRSSLTDLGQIFRTVVAERVSAFAESFSSLVDRVRNLDDSTKESIARFLTLASSIGLVLGPLLFFGGQLAIIATTLAIIATTLSVGFIPILATAAVAIGGLADSFRTIMDGGTDAESLLQNMRNILQRLKGVAFSVRDTFVDDVLPGMETFFDGVIAVFKEVVGVFSEEGGDAEGTVETLGRVIGDIFEFIGQTLLNNKEEIGSFFQTIASFISDDLLPAISNLIPKIKHFVKEYEEFASEDRQEIFQQVSSDFAKIAEAITKTIEVWKSYRKSTDGNVDVMDSLEGLLDGIASAVMNLSKFLRIATVTYHQLLRIMIAFMHRKDVQQAFQAMAIFGKIAIEVLSDLKSEIIEFFSILNTIIEKTVGWGNVMKIIATIIISVLVLGIITLVGILGIVTVIMKGVNLVMRNLGFIIMSLVAPALAVILKVIQLLVPKVDSAKQAFVFLLKEIKNLGSYLKNKGSELWSDFIDIIKNPEKLKKALFSMFSEIDSWVMALGLTMYSAGIDSMKALANGIVQGTKDHVEGAIDATAQKLRDSFHSSPPKRGPLARNPMDEAGRESIQALADGTSENKSSVLDEYDSLSSDISSMDMSPEQDNPLVPPEQKEEFLKEEGMQGIESDVLSSDSNGMIPQEQMPEGMGSGRKIVIDEKAVFFEAGAFQGVSDEELPEKVRDTVDESLDEIVAILKSKGVELE